jgi:hemin uptake protein HemP
MRTIIVLDMQPNRDSRPVDRVPAQTPSKGAPKQVSSEELLGREGELVIVHGGRQYRLRVTQNGKLILTA